MPRQIKYILFDCDNTLVRSEELAFEACADLVNELLASKNIEKRYSSTDLICDFVGQNFRGMLVKLQATYGFEMERELVNEYIKKEEDAVIAKLEAKAQPCINVMPVLEKLHHDKKYEIAVVSSSALRRVQASIKKVDQAKFFQEDRVYSAATSLIFPTSKPNPAIYKFAMEELGAKPEECIAIEDSKSGATAAIQAKIPCIGYVGAYTIDVLRDDVSRLLSAIGCEEIMLDWSQFWQCLDNIEKRD